MPESRSVRSSRPVRALIARAAAALLLTALPAVGLTGCIIVSGCDSIALVTSQRTSVLPHVAASPVDVKTDNGSIRVASGAGSDVTIVAKVKCISQERLDTTKVLAERDAGNTLRVYVVWPDGGRKGSEGCSFDITVPDASGVTASSSNGAITFVGLGGTADAKTSNGAIEIENQAGEVHAATSNGAVRVSSARRAVHAETSNGAVNVSLADDCPGPVDVHTSNGAITLGLGSGFTGTLHSSTSNGGVSVPSGSGIRVVSQSKRSATIAVGSGGPESTVETSNGSVTVTLRGGK